MMDTFLASPGSASSLFLDDDTNDRQFVDLHEEYMCCMCRKPFREPWQTSCGHRMCMQCIERRLADAGDAGFQCPGNKKECVPITREMVRNYFICRF